MVGRLIGRAREVAPGRGWLLVAVVYLFAMGINANRWHFGPDSRYYLAWAYHLGGLSEQESGRRSYEFLLQFDWFHQYCWYACDATRTTLLPNAHYLWLFRGDEGGLYVQRLVYPLLSVPFVKLFGPYGLLVVPALAYTVSVLLVVVLASRLLGRRWAPAAGVAYLLPISIAHFALYAYTEALAMCLVAACLLVLPLGRSSRPRRDPIVFGVLLLVFAFTRQFHYALLLGVVVAWVGAAVAQRRARNEWLPFVGVAVGVTAVIFVIQSAISTGYSLLAPFLKITGADGVAGIPAVLPRVVKNIVVGEVKVGGEDFGLVLVALLGAVGVVWLWRTPLAQLTAGMLVGTFGLELITALPSDNRYWALSVPMLAVLAVALLRRLFEAVTVTAPTRAPRQPTGNEPATTP